MAFFRRFQRRSSLSEFGEMNSWLLMLNILHSVCGSYKNFAISLVFHFLWYILHDRFCLILCVLSLCKLKCNLVTT